MLNAIQNSLTHRRSAHNLGGVRLFTQSLAAVKLALVASFLASPSLHAAATYTWVGNGTGSATWNTPANWSPNTGNPVSSDTATFDGTGNNGGAGATIDLGAGAAVANVNFNSGAAAYTNGTSTSQTFTPNRAGYISVNSGVTADQTFTAKINLNSGTANAVAVNITNNGTGSLKFGVIEKSSDAAQTINLSGSGNINVAQFTRSGGTTKIVTVNKTGTGTLTLTGASTLTKGAANITNGTLNVTGSLDSGTAVTVDGAAGGTLGGSGTISGTVTLANGGTIQPSSSGSANTLTLANSAAPTYNTGSKLKLRVSGTSVDQVNFTTAAAHSLANLDLTLDLTGITGNVSGATIYSVASGTIGTAFKSFTVINNPSTYSATLHYNTTTVTVDIIASASSASHSTISPATATKFADGVSTQVITVQARDASNNNISSGGDAVAFSATAGTVSATTDNGNGTYTATWTAPSSIGSGTATVTATLGGTAVGTAVSASASVVTLTAGSVNAAHSTISPLTAAKFADGVSTQVITVQARDALNNIRTTGGDTVTFSATAGTLTGTNDIGNGTYTTTWTAPSSIGSGTATVTATLGGTAVGTAVSASSSVITLNVPVVAWAVGGGNWDVNTTANWSEGGVTGFKYQDAYNVVLNDTASGASPILITNAATVTPGSVTNSATKSYTISGSAIAGAGLLAKSGSGTLTLLNSNSYTGGTLLTAGSLEVDATNALGAGLLTVTGGTLANNASAALTNAVNLAGNATNSVGAGQTLLLGGSITNTGLLTKTGTGTLALVGSNSYSGGTTLSAGIVAIGNEAAFGTGTNDFRGATVTSFDSTAHTITNALTLSVSTTFGSATTGNLKFTGNMNGGNNSKTITVSNALTEFSGVISGTGARIKDGSGTLTLSGANTYSGTTTVAGGTLVVGATGVMPTNTVSVGTNATLRGSGLILGAVVVTNNAILAPGITGALGTLTISNTLTLASGSTNNFRVSRNSGVLSQDAVAGATSVTAGGTLNVAIASGSDALHDGDTFALFNVQPSGTFSVTNLPNPGVPYNWNTANNYQTVAMNLWPTAGTATYHHNRGIPQLFTVADLVSHVSGATNGKAITLTSVAGYTDLSTVQTLPSGATLQASGSLSSGSTLVYYTPASPDTTTNLTYVVSDGLGGSPAGTVSLVADTGNVFGQQSPQMSADGNGNVIIKFYGVPGYSYYVQRADDVNFSANVTELGPYAATTGNPVITITNSIGLGNQAYYRLEWRP